MKPWAGVIGEDGVEIQRGGRGGRGEWIVPRR